MGLCRSQASAPGRGNTGAPSSKVRKPVAKIHHMQNDAQIPVAPRPEEPDPGSDADQYATPPKKPTKNRSGPSGLPLKVRLEIESLEGQILAMRERLDMQQSLEDKILAMRERLDMQQEELHGVKVLLWESKAESGHGPWDQVIQAVKGSSGDSLDMIRTVVDTLDSERHRYKRKWQWACMLKKYKF